MLRCLEQLRVDVHVLAAGRERVERLAVHEVELHLVAEHPVRFGVLVALGPVPLLGQLLRRRDDPLADRLEVVRQLRVLDDGRLELLMHAGGGLHDLRVAGAAAGEEAAEEKSDEAQRFRECFHG